jgi:glucokinase
MTNGNDLFIGLDLGGTSLKFGLGTRDGRILWKDRKPSEADKPQEVIFNVFYAAIDELLEKAKEHQGKVVAIGCGSPGAVDYDHGRLKGNTPNFVYWGNADIRGHIQPKYNIPVWADNDANVMAWAETCQGAAKGYKNVLAFTLGTGIGGGVVIDGQLFRGVNFAGAELGHMSIQWNGRPCNCGGRGCVERYASATGMVQTYVEKIAAKVAARTTELTKDIDTIYIFKKAKEGEKEALETIEETCDCLGTALASFINIFNPEIIVVGGGVADAGEEFMTKIWKATTCRAMKPGLDNLKFSHASMGNDAGIVGAISLAVEAFDRKR